jgi:hypothetical protein
MRFGQVGGRWMPGDIAGNDQAGIMRDAVGVARDS